MASNEVTVEITVEEKQALQALAKLTKSVDKFGAETTKKVQKSDKAWDSFRGNLGALAASGAFKAIAAGIKNLAVGSFEAAAATQKINTQLEVLTGSTEVAADLLKELTAFSATTPFQLQGIAEASAQLISFGFEADTVKDRIERIGEVAAGSGSDLKEVALIYGQVAAAGKLTGERLLQFQERAIPIGPALAKSLNVAESKVKDLVSAGKVGFPEFEKAFNSMSQAGGLFEGAISKQSQTINGVISTLKDNFFILQATIGETFTPELSKGATVLTQALQELTQAVVDNKDTIGEAIGFVGDYIGVYSNLAASVLSANKPIDDVNEKIEENLELTATLEERKKSLEGDKGKLFGIFDEANAANIEKVNGSLKNQQFLLEKLIEERKKIVNGPERDPATAEGEDAAKATPPEQDPRVLAEEQVSQSILDRRKLLALELELLEEELQQKAAEKKLAQSELGIEGKEVELEAIREHEENKAGIASEIQEIKDKKIQDSQEAGLAAKKRMVQEDIAISQAQANAEKAIQDARVANQEKMVAGFARSISLAQGLAKKGTAEHKALSVAAATISTYTAATRAMVDYPYPANVGVAALTVAAGLKNISEITKASFATGGVVGGFAGATNGGDNTVANLRTGEMVLNANEQKRLFDISQGKSGPDNGDSRNLELTIVTQIDEREIARSVRNQKLEGFMV